MNNYRVTQQLYNEYVKHKGYDSICFTGFDKRIKNGFTFGQICEMSWGDQETRPRSVSGTYLGRKYRKALEEREHKTKDCKDIIKL